MGLNSSAGVGSHEHQAINCFHCFYNNGNPNEFIGRLDGFSCICEIEKSLSERPALGY